MKHRPPPPHIDFTETSIILRVGERELETLGRGLIPVRVRRELRTRARACLSVLSVSTRVELPTTTASWVEPDGTVERRYVYAHCFDHAWPWAPAARRAWRTYFGLHGSIVRERIDPPFP